MRLRHAVPTLLIFLVTTSLSAQLRPASRWALGLGWQHLSTTSTYNTSGSGFGVVGTFAPMLTSTLGLEVEGRLMTGEGSELVPGCAPVPGTICESRTLVPSEVVGLDSRLAFVPDPRLRLSAGPAVAWAPNATGPNSDPALGASFGVGLSPFERHGGGLALEVKGTRFFQTLGEVDWVFGTALSYRF